MGEMAHQGFVILVTLTRVMDDCFGDASEARKDGSEWGGMAHAFFPANGIR